MISTKPDNVGLFASIPPVNAVADPQARTALEAVVRVLGVLPTSFATKQDAKDAAAAALDEALGSGANLTGIHDVLERMIVSGDLFHMLGEPIRLEMKAGVTDRINVETRARVKALLDEANARAAALALETAARIADVNRESEDRAAHIGQEADVRAQAILDEAYARGQGDGNLQTQINVLSASSSGDLNELIAAVSEEADARIAGDAAEASQRNILATQMRGAYGGTDPNLLVTGLVYEEKVARSSADGAIAVRTSVLEATVNSGTSGNTALTARIATEEAARAGADSAEVTSRQALSTKLTGVIDPALLTLGTLSSGLVYDEKSARTTADGTIASSVSSLTATVNTNYNTLNSAITTEQTVRAGADTAAATQITGINSRLNNTSGSGKTIEATIIENKNTAATETSAVAQDLSVLEATIGDDSSKITALEEVTQDHATALISLDTRTDTAESSISTLQQTTADSAIDVTDLTVRVGEAEGNITHLDAVTTDQAASIDTMSVTLGEKARVFFQASPPPGSLAKVNDLWLDSDDKNKTYRWSGTVWALADDARISDNIAAIANETSLRISADDLAGQQITGLAGRMGTAESNITKEAQFRVDKDNAMAGAINNIWAKVGGAQAVIDDGQLATVTPSSAQATKWDAVQVAVTDPATNQVSSVAIRSVLNTYASAANYSLSSSYGVTAEVTSNGRTVVGGFALIATSVAGSSHGPTIDFGIRADKFFIASTNSTPNAIDQLNGRADVPFIVVTTPQYINNVYYPAGVYLKNTIFSRDISSDNYSPGIAGTGWRLTRDGVFEANNGNFRGALVAATGTFSGTLTAAAVNAVNSINVAGNAVSVVAAAGGSTNVNGVAATISVSAADIPAGFSTVPIIVHSSMTIEFGTTFSVGVNQSWSVPGNLRYEGLNVGGCWHISLVHYVSPGTYTYACYNHGAVAQTGGVFAPYGGIRPTISVQLAKR